jgi:CubicO group peptidase (beta-lactamase class C family)
MISGIEVLERCAFAGFPVQASAVAVGMTRTAPETDGQGHYVMSSQVWMTARDSARLALLYVNNGIFDGKRLLPKDWVNYVSSTRGAQPENPHTSRYSAGFWVLDSRQGLPSGTFAMEGSRGQYAVVVPFANVIVVRRGFDPLDARFDIDRFTHDATPKRPPSKYTLARVVPHQAYTAANRSMVSG